MDWSAYLHRLNQAWLHGEWTTLEAALHPDMAMETPGLLTRLRGREACLNSFRDYRRVAVTHAFSESNFAVQQVGATAVVHYLFAIDYESHGQRYSEKGRDVWVFNREGETWLAIWRAQVSLP